MSEKPDAALDVIYSVSERVWSQQYFRNLLGRCTKELELAENCGYLIVIDAEEIGPYAYAALIQAVAQLELSLRRPAFSKVVIVCLCGFYYSIHVRTSNYMSSSMLSCFQLQLDRSRDFSHTVTGAILNRKKS
jgi:hypothetical protein